MSDLSFAPATRLVAALARKELSSGELLDHYLERVARLNPTINAVVVLDEERAREAARAADEAIAAGRSRGPLHGLPMTVKESFEAAGMRTTCGAPVLADHVSGHDADAVARLRAAGAVVFGKTNLPIWCSEGQTFNEVYGTTNNPWDLTRGPGGSSGGSAAAVVAGLSGLELGSDIAGSIRNPAHTCGAYGLKPSSGVISLRGSVPPQPGALAPKDLSAAGPLARSADDLELALDVLAGPVEEERTAWRLVLPPPRGRDLADFRLAAWLDDSWAPVEPPCWSCSTRRSPRWPARAPASSGGPARSRWRRRTASTGSC
jgi:amidase